MARQNTTVSPYPVHIPNLAKPELAPGYQQRGSSVWGRNIGNDPSFVRGHDGTFNDSDIAPKVCFCLMLSELCPRQKIQENAFLF
jgi:hypothetical protein